MNRRNAREQGSILFSTFTFLMAANVVFLSLGVIASYTLKISLMQSRAGQTYWLAKSQATYVLEQLKQGRQVPGKDTIALSQTEDGEGRVETLRTTAGDISKVSVNAALGEARHTVTFEYNEQTKSVSQWIDSDVQPQEN